MNELIWYSIGVCLTILELLDYLLQIQGSDFLLLLFHLYFMTRDTYFDINLQLITKVAATKGEQP